MVVEDALLNTVIPTIVFHWLIIEQLLHLFVCAVFMVCKLRLAEAVIFLKRYQFLFDFFFKKMLKCVSKDNIIIFFEVLRSNARSRHRTNNNLHRVT